MNAEPYRLAIYVKPGVRTPFVGGTFDGLLTVAVSAPASDGAANRAVLTALAQALDLPVRALSIAAGESSRRKSVAISGCDERVLAQIGALREGKIRRA